MSMKVVSLMAERELSSDEITLVANLMKSYNISDADYIITKLVINGWPTNWNDVNRCLRFDKFCYKGSIGIKCECDRDHSNKFNIKKLFGNGGRNINVGDKRRAFYISYYLFKYCGYRNSKEYRSILSSFNRKFRQDIDYNSFKIKYKNSWFINNNNRQEYVYNEDGMVVKVNNDNSDCKTECTELTNCTLDTEFTEMTEQTGVTINTNDTTDTTVSLLSNDFYREWEYVMKIGRNNTEFYFSV